MEQYFFMGAHLWYWLVVTTWLSPSSNRKPSLKTHLRLFYKLCIKGREEVFCSFSLTTPPPISAGFDNHMYHPQLAGLQMKYPSLHPIGRIKASKMRWNFSPLPASASALVGRPKIYSPLVDFWKPLYPPQRGLHHSRLAVNTRDGHEPYFADAHRCAYPHISVYIRAYSRIIRIIPHLPHGHP